MEQEIRTKIEKLLEDRDFVKELLKQEDENEVSALLSKQGIDMPMEAVEALMDEISNVVCESLSDEELDTVAGGVSAEQVIKGINQACDFIQKNSKKIVDGAMKAWGFVSNLFKKKKK